MPTSTQFFAKALELEKQAAAARDMHYGADEAPTAAQMHAANLTAAAALNAMLADLTLKYEERAAYVRTDTYSHSDGRTFRGARAAMATAGARWEEWQHEDGTTSRELVLDGEPLAYDEGNVPNNAYALALELEFHA